MTRSINRHKLGSQDIRATQTENGENQTGFPEVKQKGAKAMLKEFMAKNTSKQVKDLKPLD